MKRAQALKIPATGRAELDVLADDVRDRGALPYRRDVLLADAPSHRRALLPRGFAPLRPPTPAPRPVVPSGCAGRRHETTGPCGSPQPRMCSFAGARCATRTSPP